jgi:hypothetical protein
VKTDANITAPVLDNFIYVYDGSWITLSTMISTYSRYRLYIDELGFVSYRGFNTLTQIWQEFYTSNTLVSVYPVYTYAYVALPGAGFNNVFITSSVVSSIGSLDNITNPVQQGPGYDYSVLTVKSNDDDDSTLDDIEKFNGQEIYQICKTDYSDKTEFKVVKRDTEAEELTVSPQINMSDDVKEIHEVKRARFTTTKRVTRVFFNLAYSLYARPKPTQEEAGGKKGGGGKK